MNEEASSAQNTETSVQIADDGQQVRELIPKRKACMYVPPMTPQRDDRSAIKKQRSSTGLFGLGGGIIPPSTPPQFNVFHQLGARPFSQAADFDKTINLDDTVLTHKVGIEDDEDIIFLHQDMDLDNDDIVVLEEKRSDLRIKVDAEKNDARDVVILDNMDGKQPAQKAIVTEESPLTVTRESAHQRTQAVNEMIESSITQISSEYGEMSMNLATVSTSSGNSTVFTPTASSHARIPRAKTTVAQSLIMSMAKESPQTASPWGQQSEQTWSSRHLHQSAASRFPDEEDVTVLLETTKKKKKKTSFGLQSTAKSSGTATTASTSSSTSASGLRHDEEVRDLISDSHRAIGRIRSWESCRPPKSPPLPKKNAVSLMVCSYNVLCQTTIGDTGYLYRHLSDDRRHLLDWAHRSALLRKELPMLDADVYCLQEVQADHYDDFYLPLMRQMGYDGQFKKRTGEKPDGCATFWRTSKLQIHEYRWIEYNVAPNSALDRDNVGMIVKLTVKGTQAKLLVANTHLLFNQNRGDVKLAQLAMLFAHLEQMSYTGAHSSRESLIVCGDFNLEPLSPVYEFVVVGELEYAGIPQNELSGQGRIGGRPMPYEFIPPMANVTVDCLLPSEYTRRNYPSPPLPPTTGSLRHAFNLMSVYRHKTANGTFELSTYHSKEAAMPDFIFYSLANKCVSRANDRLICTAVNEGRLKCVRRLALPDKEFMDETVGRLPNLHCPSDHIPLLAEFHFDTS